MSIRPSGAALPLRCLVLFVAVGLSAVVIATGSQPAPAKASRPAIGSQLTALPPACTGRPANFWRSSDQAIAIADRQPTVRALRAHATDVAVTPSCNALGLWEILYRSRSLAANTRASAPTVVLVEDRTGDVLETSAWSWPVPWLGVTPGHTVNQLSLNPLELVMALLAVAFLALLFDFSHPWRIENLDLLVPLGLVAPLALLDRGQPLLAVPTIYPPLIYLLARMVWIGVRRPRGTWPPVRWPSSGVLWGALAGLVAVRAAFNLVLGMINDVSYASVVGADAIHHGWSLYTQGSNHLDAYGPINALAYLPFELLFPMDRGWTFQSAIPAAHAAAISFDLLTIAALYVLGRRLRGGAAGRRLGLVLACAWAANPLTLIPLAVNSNDGLMALGCAAVLLVLSSPWARGALLALVSATKFAPLALAGLLAAGRGDRQPRTLLIFGAALVGTLSLCVWLYLPVGGLALFWQRTLGFQFQRHSFMSIWGQQPSLEWLRTAVMAATVAGAAVAAILPRRRSTFQVAALGAALLVALQLTVRYWSPTYASWFLPFALVAMLAGHSASGGADRVAARRLTARESGPELDHDALVAA